MAPSGSKSDSKSTSNKKVPSKITAKSPAHYRGTIQLPTYYTWPENCVKKYEVVKRILVRWNYCMKWPDDSTTPKKLLEAREKLRNDSHQLELPGFPGIFICVHGGDLGMISDTRDMSTAPTVNNLLKRTCSELKNLWITALTEQIKVLKEVEGENAVTLPYLQSELALANKFNSEKAEKAFAQLKDVEFT